MNKLLIYILIPAVFVLVGFGCTIEKKPDVTDDGAITMPSDDADAPVPEDIGEVDTFDEEEDGPVNEIDSLIEEIEALETEADGLFQGYTGIDKSNDEELNL